MGGRMKTSAAVALGGITGALSLLCLFLSFLPASEYMMPMLAGMLLLPITAECGKRQGLLVYASVALLALFLTPSLESRVLYAAFFGYYPVLKAVLEEKLPRVPELLCKLLLFNAVICASYWLMLRFFGLDPAVFEIGGHNLPLVLLAVGNGIFLMYDRLMTILVTIYWRRLHGVFARLFSGR